MTRKILYLSGTRADFGLMRRTLAAISSNPDLDLGIIATGMHLDVRYGETIREIEADGFRIAGRISIDFDAGKGQMALGVAAVIAGCCELLEREKPDLLLLLGDRGEMLAGAIAAIHLNIPIVHIHGGERSGTVDEPIRHAISKLAHLHFTATDDAAQRLERMGEDKHRIFCVGAPGLDGLIDDAILSRAALLEQADLKANKPVALMVFHPVVQQAEDGDRQVEIILSTLRAKGYDVICLRPNADTGGEVIRNALHAEIAAPDFRLYTHLPRHMFVSWMAAADVMIGNSSSGIIEAASFGTPVINVGTRQQLRQRNTNIYDVEPNADAIAEALQLAESRGRFPASNVYGDGQSAKRISQLLADIPLNVALLDKFCAY